MGFLVFLKTEWKCSICLPSSCAFCSNLWLTLSSRQALLCTNIFISFPVCPSGAALPIAALAGQGWHKKWSVVFNCHYGQRRGAKATIRESHVWLPFSNPCWHTPLSASLFSSLLPLTIISQFKFLHSSCTLKIFPKDLELDGFPKD